MNKVGEVGENNEELVRSGRAIGMVEKLNNRYLYSVQLGAGVGNDQRNLVCGMRDTDIGAAGKSRLRFVTWFWTW